MNVPEFTKARISGLFKVLAAIVVAKVTLEVAWNNRHYFPPDFQTAFLIGRQHYFYGVYKYAFFSHVVFGPVSLLLGLLLISTRFRHRWPNAHRWIGRVQVVLVALVVAPGGLLMAVRAIGGPISVAGFAALSVLTAASAIMGYVSAVSRNFAQHERWMLRCFLLLASAVVLRLIAGAATVAGIEGDWVYPMSAWLSWLLPVAVYEVRWRWFAGE